MQNELTHRSDIFGYASAKVNMARNAMTGRTCKTVRRIVRKGHCVQSNLDEVMY